jgi:hypothetical protein
MAARVSLVCERGLSEKDETEERVWFRLDEVGRLGGDRLQATARQFSLSDSTSLDALAFDKGPLFQPVADTVEHKDNSARSISEFIKRVESKEFSFRRDLMRR